MKRETYLGLICALALAAFLTAALSAPAGEVVEVIAAEPGPDAVEAITGRKPAPVFAQKRDYLAL